MTPENDAAAETTKSEAATKEDLALLNKGARETAEKLQKVFGRPTAHHRTPMDVLKKGEAVVTAHVPKAYKITMADGAPLAVAPGTQPMPLSIFEHWYSKANGAVLAKDQPTVAMSPAAEQALRDKIRSEERQRLLDEQALAATGARPPTDSIGLRTDGPTLEEYVERGYSADKYPPLGFAEKDSPALTALKAERTKKPEKPEKVTPEKRTEGEGEQTGDGGAEETLGTGQQDAPPAKTGKLTPPSAIPKK